MPVVIRSTPVSHSVTIQFYGKFESLCPQFSFTHFPFDYQSCAIVFYTDEPLSYFYFSSAETNLDLSAFIGESEIWEYKNSSISIIEYGDPFFQVWEVSVNISFRRKYQYYIGNILLPAFGLYFLQLAALLLPPETPDRPMFSITVVLAYTFVLTSVFSLIPRTTETVYLVVLLEIKLFLSIFITCYMLLLCFIINRNEKKMKQTKSLARRLDVLIAILSFLLVLVADVTLITMMNGD